MVQVSIIIPVFNKVDFTKRCLESIKKYTFEYPDYEIIIIDNNSTDETKDFLNSLSDKNIKFIINQTNLGFAKACNQGAKCAKGKYLLFLNNDTLVLPGWLSKMYSIIEKDDNIGIVGCKLLYPDNTIQHSGVFFTFSTKILRFIINNRKFEKHVLINAPYHLYEKHDNNLPPTNELKHLQMVTGGCLLIKKELFEEINGFDEIYKNGIEDVDLNLKVRDKGKKIVYCPQSVIYHYESISEGRSTHDLRNLIIFFYKWDNKIINDEERIFQEDGFFIDIQNVTYKDYVYSDILYQANKLLNTGRNNEAVILYEQFLNKYPDKIEWKIRLKVAQNRINTNFNNILISIIMVVNNGETFLASSIDSILNQSYKNFELIIIDNGSKDQSNEIIQIFRSDKIQYIYTNKQKLSQCYNLGIQKSKGEFIVFWDQNCIANKYLLELQIYELLNNPELNLIFSDITLLDINNDEIEIVKFDPNIVKFDTNYESSITKIYRFTRLFMVRKSFFEFIGTFNKKLDKSSFLEFYLRIIDKKLNYSIKSIELPMINYRKHSNFYEDKENYLLKKELINLQNNDLSKRFIELCKISQFIINREKRKKRILIVTYDNIEKNKYLQSMVDLLLKRSYIIFVIFINPEFKNSLSFNFLTRINTYKKDFNIFEISNLVPRLVGIDNIMRDLGDWTIYNKFSYLIENVIFPDFVIYNSFKGFSISIIDITYKSKIPSIYLISDYWVICPQMYLKYQSKIKCEGPIDDGSNCFNCVNEAQQDDFFVRKKIIKESIIKKVGLCHVIDEEIKNNLIKHGYNSEKLKLVDINNIKNYINELEKDFKKLTNEFIDPDRSKRFSMLEDIIEICGFISIDSIKFEKVLKLENIEKPIYICKVNDNLKDIEEFSEKVGKYKNTHITIICVFIYTDRLLEPLKGLYQEFDFLWVKNEFEKQIIIQAGFDKEKICLISTFNLKDTKESPVDLFKIEEKKGFNFLSLFSINKQTGWDIVIESYLRTFRPDDDVSLIILLLEDKLEDIEEIIYDYIKSLGYDFLNIPDIIILNQEFSYDDIINIFKSIECFVFPCRSAGCEYLYMFSMSLGIPIIGTAWGGREHFMNNENAFLIDIKGLVDVDKDFINKNSLYKGHKWLELDKEHLSEIMRYVYEDKEQINLKGKKAQEYISNNFSLEKSYSNILENLYRIKFKMEKINTNNKTKEIF